MSKGLVTKAETPPAKAALRGRMRETRSSQRKKLTRGGTSEAKDCGGLSPAKRRHGSSSEVE
jgi:hypothetical protein